MFIQVYLYSKWLLCLNSEHSYSFAYTSLLKSIFPFPLLKDAYLLLPLRFLQAFCVSLRSSSAYTITDISTFWIPREIIIFIPYSLPLIYNLLSDNTCIYFVFLCNIYLFIQIYLLNAYYVWTLSYKMGI